MPNEPVNTKEPSNARVLIFVGTLSLVCALILSMLASGLKEPQELAKELDRSKQMMIASKILDHGDYFLIQDSQGHTQPAVYADGILMPATEPRRASHSEILEVYKKRLIPMLVDQKGDFVSFEEKKINLESYLSAYKKTGYYKQPEKLVYKILPNTKETAPSAIGYVIPINGFGLWDAIYGYLAIQTDGNTVIGISWYDQKETPGLGANIADAPWQEHFPGKKLFQEGANGQVDFKSAPLGITVVKGKVSEVLGGSPKAHSAVDGMPGATLTGTGVTTAYREVLSAYRPFLIKLHDSYEKDKGKTP